MTIEKKDINHEKHLQDFIASEKGTIEKLQPAVKTTKDILPNELIRIYPLNIVNQTPMAAKTLISILKQQEECGDKALEEAYEATYQVWWKDAPREPRYYSLLGLTERDGKTTIQLAEENGEDPQMVEVSGEDMIIPVIYPIHPKYETDYLNLGKRILNEGKWVYNERTGKWCLTIINADLEYDVGAGQFPLLTTKHSFWKSAIAEMMGYIRGYTNANDFAALGAKTWLANANENEAWLNSGYRKGDGDMGLVYGAVGNAWPVGETPMEEYNRNLVDEPRQTIDLLQKVYDDLKQGKDDRGEIWTFYNPGMFHLGCLRPCMYSHHFSILDGTLYLNSTSRSADWPLGMPYNMVQCYFLLSIMAQITGLKPGKVYHKIINAHMYEDQVEIFKSQQLDPKRGYPTGPSFYIDPSIQNLEDLRNRADILNMFHVENYYHSDRINYPFSV